MENTAQRTTKFSAGTFAVVKTSENLAYDLTEGVSTTIDAGTVQDPLPESVLFTNTNALTHASYDHKNHNVIKAKEDGTAIDGFYALSTSSPTASNLQVNTITGGYVYAAATWKVDFKLTFGPNEKNVGLFIDWSNTSFARPITLVEGQVYPAGTVVYNDALLSQTAITLTDNDANDDTETHIISAAEATSYSGTKYIAPLATGKGFRIAFMPVGSNSSYGKDRILAKQQTKENAKYVYVASPSVASDYNSGMSGTLYGADDHELLASNTAAADILTLADYEDESVDTEEALDYNNYLGLFPFTANTEVTLSFMCVAWYEGTDPEVINRSAADEYEKMTAELAFEAINLGEAD